MMGELFDGDEVYFGQGDEKGKIVEWLPRKMEAQWLREERGSDREYHKSLQIVVDKCQEMKKDSLTYDLETDTVLKECSEKCKEVMKELEDKWAKRRLIILGRQGKSLTM
jgi:ribosomal protein L24